MAGAGWTCGIVWPWRQRGTVVTARPSASKVVCRCTHGLPCSGNGGREAALGHKFFG
jgi:hypothetical protein